MNTKLRMIAMLAGDLKRQPDLRIKYSRFFEALASSFELVDIFDASLKGMQRWMNAARTFDIQRKTWKERIYKNVTAFDLRTQRAVKYLQARKGQYDVVLQLGASFDAGAALTPTVLYTDYTSALSARPTAGRLSFYASELSAWRQRENLAYHHAMHIFARSGLVRRSLTSDYGIQVKKITCVGAGFNLPCLPEPLERSASKTDVTILFIGRDFYRKGGDLLLEAFARVRERAPQARLVMMTGGPVPSGLPRAGVEVLKPTWDRARIEELYRQADIFALPSRQDPWGDVLLEAMACGLPCIGVRGNAMEEIILDSATGRVLPANNVIALAESLVELIRHPEVRLEFGRAGRERIAEEFTWERVVERMAQALEKVVNPALVRKRKQESILPGRGTG